jgi:hypothetical protein
MRDQAMKYLLRNLTRRPVSIPCNSGSYRHLPPKQQLSFDAVEIEANPMVAKLIERGVLAKLPDPVADVSGPEPFVVRAATVKLERAPRPTAPSGASKRRSGAAD